MPSSMGLPGPRSASSSAARSYILGEEAGGFPVIVTFSHLSGEAATYTSYAFNGVSYVVTSTRVFKGQSLDSVTAVLDRIPLWKPHP